MKPSNGLKLFTAKDSGRLSLHSRDMAASVLIDRYTLGCDGTTNVKSFFEIATDCINIFFPES